MLITTVSRGLMQTQPHQLHSKTYQEKHKSTDTVKSDAFEVTLQIWLGCTLKRLLWSNIHLICRAVELHLPGSGQDW